MRLDYLAFVVYFGVFRRGVLVGVGSYGWFGGFGSGEEGSLVRGGMVLIFGFLWSFIEVELF